MVPLVLREESAYNNLQSKPVISTKSYLYTLSYSCHRSRPLQCNVMYCKSVYISEGRLGEGSFVEFETLSIGVAWFILCFIWIKLLIQRLLKLLNCVLSGGVIVCQYARPKIVILQNGVWY